MSKPSLLVRQWLAATLVVAAAIWAALEHCWPFNVSPAPLRMQRTPSLAQLFLSDRYTLGFARLTVAALALFAVGSIAALTVAGRWIRGVGKSGAVVDEPAGVSDRMQELEKQLDSVTKERDKFKHWAAEMRRTTNQAGLRGGEDHEGPSESD